ncbi:ABC transporter ATP-binding protein [Kaistia dalseonensis]|uniref:Branched-chain amino acid transport system ATP-binding protein n=1 Tax=Kaistia dalseonensis TaxID=410840 RepID=A0ABU0H8Y7_9HYPH|nr:ABC transporter ATP-binding protein [Kaistia dalseonensis]MCX5495612.1 ABC transporter ATP-binding protein [Kaistia dalseonensis]MDQ0438205.1 branched-chain amino acid transport system ATP-binding protein [Kaistia dalseonensis]
MAPVLQVQNLSRRFGQIVVAHDLSFAVAHGECLGIIGPNGAGKTSVFNLLAGVIQPQAGRILLNGEDITSLSQDKRTSRGVGRTYQVPQPFGQLTAFENVLTAASYGGRLRGAKASERAAEVLALTGLSRKADLPAGGLPLLDRKRLELARAMALSPCLLLLDEIAGGLTEAEVHELIVLILAIKPSLAIVWIEHITHALSAVADRILAINAGTRIAEGVPAAVMADAAVQEIYMGAVLNVAAVG